MMMSPWPYGRGNPEPAKPGAPDPEPLPDAGIEMWRRMRFEQLGFTEGAAHDLAVSDARPEVAKQLLDAGATREQVVRILT